MRTICQPLHLVPAADDVGTTTECAGIRRALRKSGLATLRFQVGDGDVELGVPEADEVRGHIAALDPDEGNPPGAR